MPRFGTRSKKHLVTLDQRLQKVLNEVIKAQYGSSNWYTTLIKRLCYLDKTGHKSHKTLKLLNPDSFLILLIFLIQNQQMIG